MTAAPERPAVIGDPLPGQIPDVDPVKTQEWRDRVALRTRETCRCSASGGTEFGEHTSMNQLRGPWQGEM
jgi:hypothetical protein